VVGRHGGAYAYTVGQRKGLRLERPAADGRPRYVLSITPVTNTVTVGPVEALETSTVYGERPLWNGPSPVPAEVQLRAHGDVVPALVTVDGGELVAALRRPVRGVAPGQAIVAYQPDPGGDVVLGCATVSRSASAAPVGSGAVGPAAA
jgi:tRNA-uridine 2-sulfurtransferase